LVVLNKLLVASYWFLVTLLLLDGYLYTSNLLPMHLEVETIDGDQIILRELTVADASADYASWLNDPEVNKYLETRQVTVDELKSYITERQGSSDTLFLGMFWKENDLHIGNIKLEPIDFEKGEAMMGILIGNKEYWGKGVATEATNLICDYAFDQMGLKEVNLGVIDQNKAAIHVYEKCGFSINRIEKDAVDHDGELFDRIVMKKLSSISNSITS